MPLHMLTYQLTLALLCLESKLHTSAMKQHDVKACHPPTSAARVLLLGRSSASKAARQGPRPTASRGCTEGSSTGRVSVLACWCKGC